METKSSSSSILDLLRQPTVKIAFGLLLVTLLLGTLFLGTKSSCIFNIWCNVGTGTSAAIFPDAVGAGLGATTAAILAAIFGVELLPAILAGTAIWAVIRSFLF